MTTSDRSGRERLNTRCRLIRRPGSFTSNRQKDTFRSSLSDLGSTFIP